MATFTKEAAGFKNEIRDTTNEVRDDVRDVAHRAGQKVRSLFSTATDELSHASETVTTQIRKNPVQSSMVALGAGLLLGMLLRR